MFAEMISILYSDNRGHQAGEEERPATSGQEAQSQNEDSGAAHREQFALAAVQWRTKYVCGEWGNALKITRNVSYALSVCPSHGRLTAPGFLFI